MNSNVEFIINKKFCRGPIKKLDKKIGYLERVKTCG